MNQISNRVGKWTWRENRQLFLPLHFQTELLLVLQPKDNGSLSSNYQRRRSKAVSSILLCIINTWIWNEMVFDCQPEWTASQPPSFPHEILSPLADLNLHWESKLYMVSLFCRHYIVQSTFSFIKPEQKELVYLQFKVAVLIFLISAVAWIIRGKWKSYDSRNIYHITMAEA